MVPDPATTAKLPGDSPADARRGVPNRPAYHAVHVPTTRPIPHLPVDLLARLDPWAPPAGDRSRPEPDPLPWNDAEPVLDLLLGAALVALRERFPTADPEIRDEAEKAVDDVVTRGALTAIEMASGSVEAASKRFVSLFGKGGNG